MSIEVSCANGHVLRVKNSFAGKTGYCPHCRAKVHVPQPIGFSEDDVIDILGPPPPKPADEPEVPPEEAANMHQAPRHAESGKEAANMHQALRHAESGKESGIGLAGSSILRRAKRCPSCHTPTSFSFSICPTCGTPLPATGWVGAPSEDDTEMPPTERGHEDSSPGGGHREDVPGDTPSTPKKSCLKCSREIDAGTRICPHCHTYIGGLSDMP